MKRGNLVVGAVELDIPILLAGIVGSTAYGMAGPDSDTDRLGIYAAPTSAILGLHPPIGKAATIEQHVGGDTVLHEALKYCQLALSCNPTVTELMWLDQYEVFTPHGGRLVDIRSAFLSAKRVRDAYFGYATSQFHRLATTGRFQSKMRTRSEKHARHLLRLLDQGYELYSTGRLPIRVADPERYFEFGRRVAADLEADEVDHATARAVFADAEARFDAVVSPLPDRPDERIVERWLLSVRDHHEFA